MRYSKCHLGLGSGLIMDAHGCDTWGSNLIPFSWESNALQPLSDYTLHATDPTHLYPGRPPPGWSASRPASPSRCWRPCTGTPGPGGRSAPPAGAPPSPPGCCWRSWRSTRSCWAGWSRPGSQRTPAPQRWWRTPCPRGAVPGPGSPPGCKGRLRKEGRGPTRLLETFGLLDGFLQSVLLHWDMSWKTTRINVYASITEIKIKIRHQVSQPGENVLISMRYEYTAI